VPQAVLEALARPTESHSSHTTALALRRTQAGLLKAVGATQAGDDGALAFVLAGSGTMALESGLVNLVAPGEKLVVVKHGLFGDRFAAVGKALGADVVEVSCPWGERVETDRVAAALKESGARVLAATHVDTSTGVVSPFREYAKVASEMGVTMVLDAVAGCGGMPIGMDEAGIGVVISASQKALGMPPGLALLVVSSDALARRRELGNCRSYFLDWLNWEGAMRDSEARYFATLPTNLICAAGAAIETAETEGWGARFERHARMARAVRRGMRAMGLEPMADEAFLGTTVTALRLPAGLTPTAVRQEVAKDGVAVAGGLGAWADSAIRIGHMGATGLPELLQGTAALEMGLLRLGVPIEQGAGVSELLCGWEA
jgi:aspartate aminotransferase-like enzyme